jgi:hypothetical protein
MLDIAPQPLRPLPRSPRNVIYVQEHRRPPPIATVRAQVASPQFLSVIAIVLLALTRLRSDDGTAITAVLGAPHTRILFQQAVRDKAQQGKK